MIRQSNALDAFLEPDEEYLTFLKEAVHVHFPGNRLRMVEDEPGQYIAFVELVLSLVYGASPPSHLVIGEQQRQKLYRLHYFLLIWASLEVDELPNID